MSILEYEFTFAFSHYPRTGIKSVHNLHLVTLSSQVSYRVSICPLLASAFAHSFLHSPTSTSVSKNCYKCVSLLPPLWLSSLLWLLWPFPYVLLPRLALFCVADNISYIVTCSFGFAHSSTPLILLLRPEMEPTLTHLLHLLRMVLTPTIPRTGPSLLTTSPRRMELITTLLLLLPSTVLIPMEELPRGP